MSVRLYVWRGFHAWLALAPALELGATGPTRNEAMRAVRVQARRERQLFGTGIEVVEGKPPPMEDDGIL
jgi:hypothetical protein